MRECNCLETHIPRNGHTLWPSECDDYAAVCDNAAAEEEEEDYAFCKVCDDSFSVAHCGGNVVSHASRSSLSLLVYNQSSDTICGTLRLCHCRSVERSTILITRDLFQGSFVFGFLV